MILVDVNILLYATFEHALQHRAIRTWLDGQLSGSTRVGFAMAQLAWVSANRNQFTDGETTTDHDGGVATSVELARL